MLTSLSQHSRMRDKHFHFNNLDAFLIATNFEVELAEAPETVNEVKEEKG